VTVTASDTETVDRDVLIEAHTELVRYLARRIGKDLPQWMERDDLISFGWFGLIDAANRFDPERGVKFETFATPRIRGAILDGLRALDWAPRSVRSLHRTIQAGQRVLEHELGRTPTATELAEHLGLAESEIAASNWAVETSHVQAQETHLRNLVAQAIVALPDEHREVVALKYGEGLTLPKIGKRMGFGRGKATQLYEEACLLLRERLAVLA
jgi:RNA polymerase sigma factor FliA